MPGVTYFKPAGIPMRFLEENCLSLEEMEAIRLRDMEHLEQIKAAQAMNISRPTYQRVLFSARRKIADSLLSGKALRIEGGNYELSNQQIEPATENPAVNDNLTIHDKTRKRNKYRGEQSNMKIAVVSDDGVNISQHFGRASLYVVVTVEDGKVVARETRPKAGHHNVGGHHHEEHSGSGQRHGFDSAAQQTHAAMAGNITDCQVLIAGGMGWGAHVSLNSFNIEPIITDVKDIEQAVKLYLEGQLPNLTERLH